MKKNDKAMKRDYNWFNCFSMPQSYTNDKAKSERKKKSERWENGNWRKKNCWRKIFEKRKLPQILKRKNYHN
jgi:hypothetical protein